MKALIIYDDFHSAVKASASLQESALKADLAVQWNIRPWRVDMLKFPPTADEALTEALDAHLIVFAGHNARSFPFWLERWLEQWVKYRRVDEAALAVIHDRADNTSTPSARSELSRFAERRGLGFIASDFTAAETELSLSVDSMREHTLPLLSIQPGFVTGPAPNSYHSWGIND